MKDLFSARRGSCTASADQQEHSARTDAEVKQSGFITDFPDDTDYTDLLLSAYAAVLNEAGR